MKFAKLFEFDDIGQVLVKMDTGEDGPEVQIYFETGIEGVDLCSQSFGFDDSTEGWEKRGEVFDQIDEAMAAKIAGDARAELAQQFSGLGDTK